MKRPNSCIYLKNAIRDYSVKTSGDAIRLYAEACANIVGTASVLPTVDEAVAWANDLINRISDS